MLCKRYEILLGVYHICVLICLSYIFIVTNNFYKEVFNIKRENKITLCNGHYNNHKKITPEGLKE